MTDEKFNPGVGYLVIFALAVLADAVVVALIWLVSAYA